MTRKYSGCNALESECMNTDNLRVKWIEVEASVWEAQQAELKALREEVERLRRESFGIASDLALCKASLAELRQGGEAVGEVARNATGQIHMLGSDGNCFDMSKFVGAKLYTHPQPAIPPGYVVVKCGDGIERSLIEWLAMFRKLAYNTGFLWMADDAEKFLAMLASAPATQPQAAPAPVAEQDWLPIETAPRDGTEIIALDAYSYRNDPKRRMHFVLRSVFFNDEGGWEISEDGEILDEDALTHWLPRSALPASPVAFAVPADSKEANAAPQAVVEPITTLPPSVYGIHLPAAPADSKEVE